MTRRFSVTLVDQGGEVIDLFPVESRGDVGGIGREIEDRLGRAFDVAEDPAVAEVEEMNRECSPGMVECSRSCPCPAHEPKS